MTGWNCPDVVDYKDLVERKGFYYKKFTTVSFTGKITGKNSGHSKTASGMVLLSVTGTTGSYGKKEPIRTVRRFPTKIDSTS